MHSINNVQIEFMLLRHIFIYPIHAVHSFVDLVRYLFTVPGVKSFLSERISQDPIEKFFGCQRQRGRVHENPSVADFIQNTQALRVANVFARDTVKGNCRGSNKRRRHEIDLENDEPLPKRKRSSRPKVSTT